MYFFQKVLVDDYGQYKSIAKASYYKAKDDCNYIILYIIPHTDMTFIHEY